MHLFFLAAGLLVLAAFFLACALAGQMGQKRSEATSEVAAQEATPQLTPQEAEAAAETLGRAGRASCRCSSPRGNRLPRQPSTPISTRSCTAG